MLGLGGGEGVLGVQVLCSPDLPPWCRYLPPPLPGPASHTLLVPKLQPEQGDEATVDVGAGLLLHGGHGLETPWDAP